MNIAITLNQVALGISHSYFVNNALEHEASIRQGRNHHLAASIQTEQLNMVLSQFLGLLDVLGLEISTSVLIAKNIVAFSPSILAYLANRKDLGPRTRKILNFVQDHYVTVSLTVSIVMTAAFLAFGHTLYGVTTISLLGLGVLDRKGYLPAKIRGVIYQTGFIVSNITGFVYSDPITKCLSLINLVGIVANGILQLKLWKSNRQFYCPHPTISATQVTPALIKKLKENCPIHINKSHVNKPFLPSLRPGVNLNQLIEYSEKIDWSKHKHVLLKKLEMDARWTEVGILESADPIKYFKKCLRAFVESVKERNIVHGQPAKYDKLEHYCLVLTQELANQDENTNVDVLLEIGLGGEYCGSGKFRILEERVGLIVQCKEDFPLENRILAYLQGIRVTKWNSIYEAIWKKSPISQWSGWYLDKNDIHIYNLFLNISDLGKECGIPHEGAINDRTAEAPPWVEYFASRFRNVMKKAFWENEPIHLYYFKKNNVTNTKKWNPIKWYSYKKEDYTFESYTVENIISSLSKEIGKKNSIPKPPVYEWWKAWILKQKLNEKEKELLLDQLTLQNKLFDLPFETDGKIHPVFLKAMLFEMGILY